MGWVLWFIATRRFMRVNGKTIKSMDSEHRNSQTIAIIKENIKTVSLRAKELISGITVKFMKANGGKEKDMERVNGKELMEIHMMENGDKENLMVMEF